ncbi:recombinase family protein [Streptosporangium sp. NBC_01469]|uniref:recombinase family protein n=1 Tax=Streptosporangium sp. NBC_01469 TaxID=2903898 RepID=UPI002E2E8645|nr:recombinase family protein [Streptosporangium sp. NBC_01469]
MERTGRPVPADHLTAHGLVLEMLAGPLAGIYDPAGPGRILFAFFAAMAETEREAIREATLEGLDAAARLPPRCATPRHHRSGQVRWIPLRCYRDPTERDGERPGDSDRHESFTARLTAGKRLPNLWIVRSHVRGSHM